MKILAIETATEACSAALWLDGTISERFEIAPRGHGERILAMVDALLAEGGLALGALDAIAFGCGPGAFTGLRIAAGVAQGLAFGADLPVAPVSTLAALAQGALRERHQPRVLAVLDARMGEVYWGAYEQGNDGLMQCIGGERVCAPAAVARPDGSGWFGAGSGFAVHGDELRTRLDAALGDCDAARLPRARDVAQLATYGGWFSAARALPVYLRDQVADVPSGGGSESPVTT
jgi:tRNA threonylcarbamoyladenosine biosynthesis protein TsaB